MNSGKSVALSHRLLVKSSMFSGFCNLLSKIVLKKESALSLTACGEVMSVSKRPSFTHVDWTGKRDFALRDTIGNHFFSVDGVVLKSWRRCFSRDEILLWRFRFSKVMVFASWLRVALRTLIKVHR